LKAELSHEAADEWSKIFLREPKAYYALLTMIDPFYLKHKKIFSSLAKMGHTQSLSYYAMRMGTPPQGISKEESQDFLKSVMNGSYQFITKDNYKTNVPKLPVLMVTHASSIFHTSKKIKPVLDKLVVDFKQKQSSVIFLLHNDETEDYSWFSEDRKPDFALFSHGGEHSFLLNHPEVTMVGGYFSQCFRRSVQDTITRYFLTQKNELHITLPMAGIYTGQDSTLLSDFEKSPTDFLKLILNSLFWGKKDPYDDSMDGDKDAIGELDLRLYQFTIIKDNKVLTIKGNGPRKVKLFFKSDF
jgi:hypothetical protein